MKMKRFRIFPLTAFFIPLLTAHIFAQSGIYIPNPDISANGTVRVVVIHDTILYVGGSFTRVTDDLGSYARKGLASFNLITGRVTQFKADINQGVVRSIAVDDSLVYAGGTFTKINKISRSKIAALDPVSGDVINTFSSGGSKINGPVFALCCLDDKLFVGGNFTRVNGIERSYLAALDKNSGVLDSSFNPSPRDSIDVGNNKMEGGVTALGVHPGNDVSPGVLFVGGNFQTVTGIDDGRFLVAIRSDGSPGPVFKNGPDYPLLDIYCKGTVLYAGIGGYGNRAAAYDISSTSSYTELWKGIVVQGDVQAITCSDRGFVFFSFHQGLFDTTDFYRCAVIDGKTGFLYDTLPSMSSFFGVWTLDIQKDILVAGGAFTSIGGRAQSHLAVFKIPHYQAISVPEQVVLSDPPDRTIVTSLTPRLVWKFVPYAENCDIQIATDSLFEKRIATYSKISTFAKRCPELKSSSRYFWRVRANNQLGSGSWSAIWQFYTEPEENDLPKIVKPADGAQYQPISFNCIWRTPVNALSYDIQVAGDENFATVLFDSSNCADNSVIISGLSNDSHYFLRVRSNTFGGSTVWAYARFSTVPAPPRAPVQKMPSDNGQRVSCIPVFSWEKVSDATSYRLQISTDSHFLNESLTITGLNDSSITSPELTINTPYFWRVRAENRWGSSSWSEVWQFSTGTVYRTVLDIVQPLDGANHQPISLRCVWHPVVNASCYTVQLSMDQDFATTLFDIKYIPDTTAYFTGLLNGSRYYLRVGAVNDREMKVWSYCSFTTVCATPGTPVGKTPVDNEIQVTCIPSLIWESVSSAASYRVQLSTDSNFTTNILDSIRLTDTIQRVPELSMDTRYFWRVNASNDGGEVWSLPMRFTTMYPVPCCPLARFPKAGYSSSTDSVKFVWSGSSPHVTGYLIEIAHDSAMNDLFLSAVTTDTTYALHGLFDNERIFWRVRARNKTGESNYSATEVFTTVFPAVLRYSLGRFNFFRGLGHISYSIAEQSDVVIRLFNLKGKMVWQSKVRNVLPGYYSENLRSGALPAGHYIVKIKAGAFTKSAGAMLVE